MLLYSISLCIIRGDYAEILSFIEILDEVTDNLNLFRILANHKPSACKHFALKLNFGNSHLPAFANRFLTARIDIHKCQARGFLDLVFRLQLVVVDGGRNKRPNELRHAICTMILVLDSLLYASVKSTLCVQEICLRLQMLHIEDTLQTWGIRFPVGWYL